MRDNKNRTYENAKKYDRDKEQENFEITEEYMKKSK